MRCLEILLTLFLDPTRTDPLFAAIYQTFTHARRLLRKNENRYLQFIENFSNVNRESAKANGPVAGFTLAAKKLGIVITCENGNIMLATPCHR